MAEFNFDEKISELYKNHSNSEIAKILKIDIKKVNCCIVKYSLRKPKPKVGFRFCYQCKEEFKEDNFYTKNCKIQNLCISCNSENCKKYRQENKKTLKIKSKQKYDKNKEQILQQKKEYYLKNREKILLEKKEYFQKNKDKKRQYMRKYIKNNPEISRAYSAKRRERQKNIEPKNLSKKEIKSIFEKFDNKCFNCKTESNLCLDHHYPLSKGFPITSKNAVVLCVSCNSKKFDKNPEEFYSEDQIYNLHNQMQIARSENDIF